MTRAIIWCAVSTGAQAEDERFSLPQQESDARALAESKGWKVIDVMTVSGHSRRYKDFGALAEAAASKGIDAFYRLQAHWERRDFDYLICRDGDRFARSQALFARITEEVIETAGARVWSLNDGQIDRSNYRMWIAMRGMQAASDVDKLVKYHDEGMKKRAAQGLPTSSRTPISHKLIRNAVTGKAERLIVNEEKRALWDDLYTLILEGVSWEDMEEQLLALGHVNHKGKHYHPYFFYRLVNSPSFWGHQARHQHSIPGAQGAWTWDESIAPPEGVTVWRNTHSPVWAGEQGDRIRAELQRRFDAVRGRATPRTTHRFAGLGICGECGSFLITQTNGGYRGLICPAAKRKPLLKYPACNNRKIINERRAIAILSPLLQRMIDLKTPNIFESGAGPAPSAESRIEAATTEITKLEQEARELIRLQRTAGEQLQAIYADELDQINTRLRNLRDTRTKLQGQSVAEKHKAAVQQVAIDNLAQMSVEAFWKQDSRVINQTLHQLLGKNRLVLLHGEIVAFAEVNRRQRKRI